MKPKEIKFSALPDPIKEEFKARLYSSYRLPQWAYKKKGGA